MEDPGCCAGDVEEEDRTAGVDPAPQIQEMEPRGYNRDELGAWK